MILPNLFKIDHIICEELFTLEDVENAIQLPAPTPAGSKISPETTVDVTITKNDLIIDEINNLFLINFSFYIDKTVIIERPGMEILKAKYAFPKSFDGIVVESCTPSQVPPEILDKLFIYVADLRAEVTMALHPNANTFDDPLTMFLKVQILFTDQVEIPEPVPPPPPPPPQPIPIRVINAIDLVAGKIREWMSPPKKEIYLKELNKARDLAIKGNIDKSAIILTIIANEIQLMHNLSPSRRKALNLVLGDLIIAKQEVKKVL